MMASTTATNSSDLSSAAVAPSSSPGDLATTIVQDLQRHVNKLTDPTSDRFTKTRTLDHVAKQVVGPLIRTRNVDTLTPVLRVLVPVLARILADPIEKCREASANMLRSTFELVAVDSFLPAIVPTLVDRLSGPVLVEPSEELRLVLIKLLALLVSRCESEPSFIVQDCCLILFSTLGDSFPDVRKESCNIVNLLATRCPSHLRLHAEKLIKKIVPALGYRHAAIRISALQALGSAVMTDAGTLREIWPSVQRLTLDSVANVRRQLYTTTTNWALHLPDRYSFGDLFVLVLLSGLADDVAELSGQCRESIAQVSKLYEHEWESRVKDALDYAPASERELLGFRALVRDNLLKMTDALVEQLADWTVNVREGAARTLTRLIPFAKEHISGYLGKLVPAMAKTVSDPFAKLILQASEEIGRCVSPDLFLNLTLPHVRAPSYLVLLASAIRSAPLTHAHMSRILSELLDLIELDPSATSQPDIARVYVYLTQHLASGRASTMGDAEADGPSPLFILTLGLQLAAHDDVKSILLTSPLHPLSHLPTLLAHLADPSRGPIVMHSPSFLLLRQILSHAPTTDPTVSPLHPTLVSVLDKLSGDNDAIAAIAHDLVASRPASEFLAHPDFVLAVWPWTMRRLEWRAGRPAMAVRASLVPLIAVLVGTHPDLSHVLPVTKLPDPKDAFAHPHPSALADAVVHLANCLDDDLPAMRLMGTRVLGELMRIEVIKGMWDSEMVKAAYPELLKRLDDAKDHVRVEAAKSLAAIYDELVVAQRQEASGESGTWMDSVHHQAVVQGVTIHVDDGNVAVSTAALDCLRAVARHHSKIVREYIETSTRQYKNRALFGEFLS
ncbi:armadillo-type protein [Catenaria anguillulae PL171]|uniref:Armadillo-type protein n=1 Tax=Catenaria anguillulae PL171 TaxID=765915 RepID=A0A1Y2HBL5_9FUNG|nr:armadillo-type protein [Catenaria anguillulae PL171]